MTGITEDTIVTGLQFRDFYKNHWPAGWYVEDMPYEAENENGDWVLDDDARHPLSWFGVAYFDGSSGAPEGRNPAPRPMHEVYAQAMNLLDKTSLVTFRIDNDQLEAFLAAALAAGATKV